MVQDRKAYFHKRDGPTLPTEQPVLLTPPFIFRSPGCRILELRSPWLGPITRSHHLLLNTPTALRSSKELRMSRKKGQRHQNWRPNNSENGSQAAWVTFAFTNLTRRVITPTPVATFDKDLKGLVSAGNPCLVTGEDIPEVPQDYILYYNIQCSFKRLRRNLGFE